MKSLILVPMSDKQNTTTSTELDCKGVWDISQGVTLEFMATKSKEWTVFWGTLAANVASPQPKSAIIQCFGLLKNKQNELCTSLPQAKVRFTL